MKKETFWTYILLLLLLLISNKSFNSINNNSHFPIDNIKTPNSSISPIPTISSSEISHTNKPSFFISVDFGMVVTPTVLDDLNVTNGMFSDIYSGDNIVWQYNITPTTEGLVSIQYPADKYEDAGDWNLISNLFLIIYDTSGPVPTISSSEPSVTNKPSFSIDVDFDMVVTPGFTDDLVVTNGVFSDWTSGDNIVWQYNITPTTEGIVTIEYPADQYTDDAGNNNSQSNVFSITYDTSGPVPTISSSEPSVTNKPNFYIEVNFDMVVTLRIAELLIVSNGMFNNLSSGDNVVWTYSITPTTESIVTIQFPADKYTDGAGNYNNASNMFEIKYEPQMKIIAFPIIGISIFSIPIVYILIKKSKKRIISN